MPSTQLFAVSVGIMAMEAAAHGFCSCADPLPAASWKTTSEPHEKVTYIYICIVWYSGTSLIRSHFGAECPY